MIRWYMVYDERFSYTIEDAKGGGLWLRSTARVLRRASARRRLARQREEGDSVKDHAAASLLYFVFPKCEVSEGT